MGGERAWPTDDRVKLAVAMISGAVQRCVEMHATTREEALIRIREITARQRLTAGQVVDAVTYEAACYLTHDVQYWYRDDALALLVEAGADLDRARKVARLRDQHRRVRFGDATF
jgi:hypothetical protein